MSKSGLKKGRVLFADPFMLDPNFKRAVVLLCEYNEKGAIGFVMNKTTDMKINELIVDFPEFNSLVHFGGPVQTDTIHYIHNVGDLLEDSLKVVDGVYWGGDFEKLKFLISNQLIKPENIRFFLGYTGWSPGQLIDEIQIRSWLQGDMYANYLFKNPPFTLWQKALEKQGNTYSVIAQIPDEWRYN